MKELPMISLQPWTNRMSKMTQPNLDYIGKNVKMVELGWASL